jgi:hypothetical protein
MRVRNTLRMHDELYLAFTETFNKLGSLPLR